MDWLLSPSFGLSIAASAVSILQMVLLARKNAWGWWVGLANQPLWLYIEIVLQVYGAIVLVVAMVVVNAYGLIRWRMGTRA